MKRPRRRRWRALFGAAAALFVWAAVLEPRHLVVRERELSLPGWPSALDGLRVGLVGDLHVGAPPMDRARTRKVIDRLAAQEADLLVFLGDLVDTKSLFRSTPNLNALSEDLANLRAPLGTFAVLGNHDHWFGARRVRDTLERAGIPALVNETRRLPAAVPLDLVGVDDAYTGHDDLLRALRGSEGPRIVVTHTADLFVDVPSEVSLTLAAHTHGGQVRLPLVGPLFVPSRFGTRWVRGHYVEEGRHLWVTSGVGNSMIPVRIGVPPELVVLTLRTPAH
ncbi:MAG: metallophosphoesterase [Sandaracinus sp.]|nr:metallophosphoesterase [Sandaracinus sp.]MCB9614970.1 metallophosphoesterase [Sandaracinus sp.]